jgi:hypothetical protein
LLQGTAFTAGVRAHAKIGCDRVFSVRELDLAAKILMWHGTMQVDNCSHPVTK